MDKFFPRGYIPTLAIRVSEMRALKFLPGDIQKRITPCILLAPWATSKSLKGAIKCVEEAFPRRGYFLDIDRNYQYFGNKKPAQQEFDNLSDIANWVEFIRENEYVCPCIQFEGRSEKDIRRQIETIQKLGRQYCMRIERERFPSNFDEIVSAFAVAGPADFTIILEGGWVKNALDIYAWFDGLVNGGLQKINANVPIVISCTSIPKEFSNINGTDIIPFGNRQLMQQLRQKSNRSTIIYGDWGSTRPRDNRKGGGIPPARIDYPIKDAWYVARNPGEGWDFKRAAQELIDNSGIWDDILNAWGVTMIRNTKLATLNKKDRITTLQKSVEARVSIHLHRQALYGQDDLQEVTFEDDWED